MMQTHVDPASGVASPTTRTFRGSIGCYSVSLQAFAILAAKYLKLETELLKALLPHLFSVRLHPHSSSGRPIYKIS